MATGGDTIEITYNHQTIGSGRFYAKAKEDATFNPGGYTSNDDDAGVDGGGNMIDVIQARRWKYSVLVSWDMNSENEIKKLEQLAANPSTADFTISMINGTVWGATGKPVGDFEGSSNATFTLTLAGGGKLEKISG